MKANKTSFKKGHGFGKRFKKGQIAPMKGKKRPDITGSKHPNWKGGITRTSTGYILQSVNGKQVYQHRFVMEKHLGRKLSSNETVHHINGTKTDNRLENLELMSRSEHTRLYGYHSSHKTKTR
ncbi:MAG TPA: HNH endonuclease [bacterium]|nr:HNH endonuclease [bacterium]